MIHFVIEKNLTTTQLTLGVEHLFAFKRKEGKKIPKPSNHRAVASQEKPLSAATRYVTQPKLASLPATKQTCPVLMALWPMSFCHQAPPHRWGRLFGYLISHRE